MTAEAQKKIEETARLAAEAVIKRGGTVKEANEAGNKAAAAAAKAAVEAAKSVGDWGGSTCLGLVMVQEATGWSRAE